MEALAGRSYISFGATTLKLEEPIYVGAPVPVRTHDRVAITNTGVEALLEGSPYLADLGYQGTTGLIPYKQGHRPGIGKLGEHDQNFNKGLARYRAAVERGNAHLKNWKTSQKFTVAHPTNCQQ